MPEPSDLPKKEHLPKEVSELKKPTVSYLTDSEKQPHATHIHNKPEIKKSIPEHHKPAVHHHTEHKSHKHSDDHLLEIRKDKAIAFIKNKASWIWYLVLAYIVWISVFIRTRNLGGLRDITTQTWTLGPDLDPFLFLRWSKAIVEQGSLYVIDTMRYVPLGFNTSEELLLHPYLMAWFHKIAVNFGSESVTHSAVLYPVAMFALTIIAFFAMVRIIFRDSLGETRATIVALISSFFLAVIPVILPRTIAGIPEKESAGFLFLFLGFYLFVSAWRKTTEIKSYVLSALAGAAAAGMTLIWGGSVFLFYTIGITILFALLLGQLDKRRLYGSIIWMTVALILTYIFTTRFSISALFTATPHLLIFLGIGAALVSLALTKTKFGNFTRTPRFEKIPIPVIALIIMVIFGFVGSVAFFGFDLIERKASQVKRNLITPISDRFGVTVAENRQPYFTEWVGSFGPHYQDIPLLFWLFILGSVVLVFQLTKEFRKGERWSLTGSYFVLLMGAIFSRYSPSSTLNGTSAQSLIFYGFGIALFLYIAGKIYYRKYHNNQELLKSVDTNLILLLTFSFLSILAARGAVRLIMVLAAPTAIFAGYLAVTSTTWPGKVKDDLFKMITWAIVFVIIAATFFAGFQFYQQSKNGAGGQVPNSYSQQWQQAMAWVRANTDSNAVFGHWWDYGYWVQSIGERATVLDGGNAIPYWNHLMGRHALTGSDNDLALSYLFTHKTTHFLIDSTDIGKYGAFSSIGSGAGTEFDRRSYFTFFSIQGSRETKENLVSSYTGSFGLDQDVVYETNGTTIFLPEGRADLDAINVHRDKETNEIVNVEGIFVDQENGIQSQHTIPMRYIYSNGELTDLDQGINAGVYLMPAVDPSRGSLQRDAIAMYLSNKTVQSQLARLYLYKEDNPNFKLVHSENDVVVKQLQSANALSPDEDIVFMQGFRGPLRIWEIDYPEGMVAEEEFMSVNYPSSLQQT